MWSHCFSSIFLLSALLTFTAASSDECVYTLYVETGSVIKAGTDSKISIALGDSNNKSVSIPNLKDWGLMGRKHDYFERGNLDIFSGRGPCIGHPICRINVTSDGSGSHHGWYCDNIQVTSSGPYRGCSQSIFHVDQWLASDAPPYQLSVVLDACGLLAQSTNGPNLLAKSTNGPFIVRKSVGSARQ
ncbi:hypothetical protein ACS0TY_001248 [Phlomoides rotata]